MASKEPDPYYELFERSADAILIIEGDEFVDCNRATVEMLRYRSKEELLRTHPSELSPPRQPDGRDSYEKANEMIAIAFERGSHRFEWDHQRADGEVFPVEVLLTAVQRGDKRILHVVWRDITDRKQLEQYLRQAQKMEAIGKLAGGIAHDFNNLLVAIIGHAELLALALADRPSLAAQVQEIRQAGDRAAALVRQLLTFSRKRELSPRVVDLDEILEETHRLLERLIGEHVRLETIPAGEPVRVKVDPVQIEQVIMNLATNARDAMPDGGVLSIEVRRVVVDETSIGRVEGLEAGPYAVISVSDTGIGMDAATVARVFDPFFTTKGLGEGTGLGLSTVYGIAKGSGGAVDVVSAPGRGTTIRVFFPITLEEAISHAIVHTTLPTEGGDETILVAEDDEAVARLVHRVLTDKGYRVLLASDGVEALSLWEHYADEIDLVFTDVVMPNLGGPDMVMRLREAGATVPVLFASGYTNNALARMENLGEALDLVEKPYSAAELAGRIRLTLDRDRDR